MTRMWPSRDGSEATKDRRRCGEDLIRHTWRPEEPTRTINDQPAATRAEVGQTATAMPPSGGPPSVGSILATTLPAATAISVFGTLYGAGARSLLGAGRAIGSSLGRATGA